MVPSQPVIALAIAAFLVLVTVPIARKVAATEQDPGLYRIIMVAAVVHLFFTVIQVWVVDHVYHGITDYTRYVDQGATLAHRFDAFNFSLAGTNITVLGSGAVGVAAGIVFSIVGVDKLAGFFVFSWLGFFSALLFYRAFAITFPEGDRRRYALMVLFLPSLLFWTAGISKETLMIMSLAVTSYGAARILAYRPGGALLLALGVGIGVYVRPQELVLFLAAFVIASVFRRQGGRRRAFRGIRLIAVLAVQAALLFGAVTLTQQLSKHGAPVFNLTQVASNNRGQASSVPYIPGPKGFFHDVYTVLLDPLPFDAHGNTQRVAAVENTIIVVLILVSWRRLRYLLRVAFMKPYVLMSMLYATAFLYVFAALANLGLIDRERVLLLPFLLVPLAIPISPKGSPPQYPWETSARKKRRSRNVRWATSNSPGR
jgi:hypothetical protein